MSGSQGTWQIVTKTWNKGFRFLSSMCGVQVKKQKKQFSFFPTKLFGQYIRLKVNHLNSPSGHNQFNVFLRPRTSDWSTFQQIFVDCDYSLTKLPRKEELRNFYESFCASGTPLIIDAGANIGLASLYFSHVWPASKIIAIEPEKSNFQLMLKNCANNPSITALQAGLSSTDCNLAIANPSAENWAFRVNITDAPKTEAIPGVSINSILANYPRKQGYIPFVVKIDIEGFESEVFKQDFEWIDAFPVLIIELHDYLFPKASNSSNFLKAISQFNRDFVFHGENVFSIKIS